MKNSFFSSSVGKKILMAGTGLLLLGFLFGHMAGNLQIFAGSAKINAYAQTLKDLGPLLWLARLILLFSFIVHIRTAIVLKRENINARPQKYHMEKNLNASFASRTMIFSGLAIGFFLIYHIMHFTTGNIYPQLFHATDEMGRHDVYKMIISGFSLPEISGVYILAVFFVSLHLYHGISSSVQSLGIASAKTRDTFHKTGIILSLLLFAGNVSIPVSILAGFVK